MKMVANPATLSRTSPLLYRFVGFSSRPTSHLWPKPEILSNTSRITSLRHYALSNSCLSPPNYRHQSVFRHLGPSNVGLKLLGFDRFRLLADSGGGSGGLGGSGDGNYGGGGEGGGSGAADGGRGGGWSFISWYLSLLAKYPVLTKAITSAILTFAGDLICQLMNDQVSSLDVKRTFLFTFLGLVLVGPTLHFWYLSLSKLVTLHGASGAFLRLLLDQFIFSPTFIGVFLATLLTLEGRPSEVIPKLKQEWFSAVIANWQLWIPFQFLNFRFVPQHFQVLAANVIALVWNVILSFKAHKELLQK